MRKRMTMNKPLFSVCLIARNEEITLPRLVGSLSEFLKRGGKIHVLDTGSTDKTAEVARKLGCNVIEVGDKFRIKIDKELADKVNSKFVVEGEAPVVKEGESLFDFATARNYIAEFADTDVISTPDCDEIFTKFDIDKLNEVIADGAEQLEYEFVFSHDDLGNPIIKFRHCKFYNRKKLKWHGVVHEVLGGSAKMVYLGEDIIKLEHYQNEKTNRSGYLKGLAIDCYQNPENDRNSHYFAREMMYLGRYKSAIKEFKNHISMNRWPTEAAQSMMFIGDCYSKLGDYDEMLKWYSKSVEKEVRREPLMRLAEYYFYRKMYPQAIAYLEATLTVKQLPFYSNHQPYYEDIPHALLYVSYWWIGDKEKSKEHWEKALSFNPKNSKYIEDGKFYSSSYSKITFIIPTLGREEGLKRCLDSIEKLNYPKEKIEVIVKQDSFENRTGVPKLLKQGVEESTGDWIVFGSNDTEFTPNSINEALKVGDKGFVSFNTGTLLPDGGNRNEHFMIRRDIIEKIGEIFDTRYFHLGVDNLLAAKMDKLGIFVRAEKAIVHHYHFTKLGGVFDEVYKIAWSEENIKHDRELLKEDLEKLNAK
jgi:glycosyltransferase involved in cell wall biosynthesis